jgi:hypothetical protein
MIEIIFEYQLVMLMLYFSYIYEVSRCVGNLRGKKQRHTYPVDR